MLIPNEIKEIDIFNPYTNQEVTRFYCEIIRKALESIGFSVNYVNKLEKVNDIRGLVVVRTWDAFIGKKMKYKYVITWIQGIAPEETWLQLKSPLRFLYVLYHEILGLLSSNFNVYCSDYMRKHYEKRFVLKAKNYFVMPCFNEEIKDEFVLTKEYEKNVFCYSGGLDKWQCFEKTAKIYKKIEELIPNVFFKVLARDKAMAKQIIEEYGIKNYSIDYVSQAQLSEELKKVKFGFCIRDDIEVNRVATPTKLSGYISNGIIPIFSKCLTSFYGKAKDSKYCLNVDDEDFFKKIENLCRLKISSKDVIDDFKKNFGDYYSEKKYVVELSKKLSSDIRK